jgi:hypothetical protein
MVPNELSITLRKLATYGLYLYRQQEIALLPPSNIPFDRVEIIA